MKRWAGIDLFLVDRNVSVEKIIRLYGKFRKVEEIWRMMKNDMRVRPIWLWNEERVKGHILISLMAVSVARYMEEKVYAKTGRRISWRKIRDELWRVRILEVETDFVELLRNSGRRGRLPKVKAEAPARLWMRTPLTEAQCQILEAFNIRIPKIVKIETLEEYRKKRHSK